MYAEGVACRGLPTEVFFVSHVAYILILQTGRINA
jgi:hypothetical protein